MRNERGFTLLEVLVVVGILGALAGMAMMVSPGFSRHARAEAGIAQVLDVLRSGREVAVSQRRNVQIEFIGLNAIRTRRVDIDANGTTTGTTVLRTVELENRVQFRLEADVPDTPDAFGNATAIDFDTAGPWLFTSEGTLVNGSGDPINGTVFLAIPNQQNSARAVTIVGTTALIRPWHWNGRNWVE
jgi:prepilin-type N-terminal cleavage/methylation domain-containing protein